MMDSRIEYVGFTVNKATREYCLRAKLPEGEFHDFTLAISNEAFITHRARYQDAPEICFLKLQRELIDCGDIMPESHHHLTDDELEDYRMSHIPKAKEKRLRTLSQS
jgi:hypothetical protein